MRKISICSYGRIICAALALSFLALAQANAATVEYETPMENVPKEPIWVVGLGAAIVPDYEGSDEYEGAPIPLVKYLHNSGWSIELVANTLRANLLPHSKVKVGPLVRFRGERDDVENEKVDRMIKVNSTAEIGAFAGYKTGMWDFRLDFATDSSDGEFDGGERDGHGGSVTTFQGGYSFLFSEKWSMVVSGYATWASDEYMETYFGVSAADSAASGLPMYSAEGGLKDVGSTVIAAWKFNQPWSLMFGGRLTALTGDAADSPIVDDEGSSTQLLTFGVVTYTF